MSKPSGRAKKKLSNANEDGVRDFILGELLSSASDRMTSDLKDRLIKHPGELGTDREEIVRSFLRAYLPKRFEISDGFVFDANGVVSEQIDLVIADSMNCARFETMGGTRYYPCESVVGVGQIKSSITSERQLVEAFQNIESVKRLDRSANGRAVDRRFGEPIDPQTNHLHQIFGFVFNIGRTISESTIQERVLNYIQDRPPYLWPNILLSLDHYLVTFCCPAGVCPNPMDARGVVIQRIKESPDIVMKFFLLLGQAIEVTRTAGLPYGEYLKETREWDAMAYHSTEGDPPEPLYFRLGF